MLIAALHRDSYATGFVTESVQAKINGIRNTPIVWFLMSASTKAVSNWLFTATAKGH